MQAYSQISLLNTIISWIKLKNERNLGQHLTNILVSYLKKAHTWQTAESMEHISALSVLFSSSRDSDEAKAIEYWIACNPVRSHHSWICLLVVFLWYADGLVTLSAIQEGTFCPFFCQAVRYLTSSACQDKIQYPVGDDQALTFIIHRGILIHLQGWLMLPIPASCCLGYCIIPWISNCGSVRRAEQRTKGKDGFDYKRG